jgi:hypothetical protein
MRTDEDRRRAREYRDSRNASILGAYCVICGRGPFVRVGTHARRIHGISRDEYKRRFPGALLTHPDLVQWFATEARANGSPPGSKRQRYCKRGHALRGANVVVHSSGQRQCRTCRRQTGRPYQREWKRRQHGWSVPNAECPGCGELFAGDQGLGAHRSACPGPPSAWREWEAQVKERRRAKARRKYLRRRVRASKG